MERGIRLIIVILACAIGLYAYGPPGHKRISLYGSKVRQCLQHKASIKPDVETVSSSSWSSSNTKKKLLDQAKLLRDEAQALASRVSGTSADSMKSEKVDPLSNFKNKELAKPVSAFIEAFGATSRNLAQYTSAPYNHTLVFEATRANLVAAANKSEDILDIKQGLDNRKAFYSTVRSEVSNSSSVIMETISLLVNSLDSPMTASLLQLLRQRKDVLYKGFNVSGIVKSFLDLLLQSIPKEESPPILKELFTYALLSQLARALKEKSNTAINQFKLLELVDDNVLGVMSGSMLALLEDLLLEINPAYQRLAILLPSTLKPGQYTNATVSMLGLMQDLDYAIRIVGNPLFARGFPAYILSHVVRTLHNCNVLLQTEVSRPKSGSSDGLAIVSSTSTSSSFNRREVSDILEAVLVNKTASSILAQRLHQYKQELFANFDAPVLLGGILTTVLSWTVPADNDKPLYRDLFICALYEELNERMKGSEGQLIGKVSELFGNNNDETDKVLDQRMKNILSMFSSDILPVCFVSAVSLFSSNADNTMGSFLSIAKKDCIANNSFMLEVIEKSYQSKSTILEAGGKSLLQVLQNNRKLLKQLVSTGAMQSETMDGWVDKDRESFTTDRNPLYTPPPNSVPPYNLSSNSFNFVDMLLQQQQGEDIRPVADFLSRAFPLKARKEGAAVNKKGAALLQRLVLKDMADVNEVSFVDGAVVFSCSVSKLKFGSSSEVFMQNITDRLVANNLSSEISFAIIDPQDIEKFVEKYVLKLLNLPSQAAMMARAQGSGIPVEIVFFPTSWNVSTSDIVTAPSNNGLSSIFRGITYASPMVFIFALVRGHVSYKYASAIACSTADTLSANLLDKLDFNALSQMLLNSYCPLLASSFVFSFVMDKLVEFQAFKQKLPVHMATIPSLTLPQLGKLQGLQGFPKDLNAVFDVFFVPQVVSLLSSLVLLGVGISLTNSASADAIPTLPVIDVSILQCNNIVESLLKTFLKPELIDKDFVHVHWLGILGMTSFITSVIQLLPLSGSTGEFIGQAALGRIASRFVHGLINSGISIYMLFNVFQLGQTFSSSTPMFAFNKLLIELVLWKIFMPKTSVDIPARNQFMDGVDDLRKLGYIALMTVLLLSLIPYQRFDIQPQEIFSSVSDWLSTFNTKL